MQNPELELQYKSCYARILDAKRRFLEAATRYYDLSQSSSSRTSDGPKVGYLLPCSSSLFMPLREQLLLDAISASVLEATSPCSPLSSDRDN